MPVGNLFRRPHPISLHTASIHLAGGAAVAGGAARVDTLLDEQPFFAPFRAYFDLTFGRPSIPVETYLRLRCS